MSDLGQEYRKKMNQCFNQVFTSLGTISGNCDRQEELPEILDLIRLVKNMKDDFNNFELKRIDHSQQELDKTVSVFVENYNLSRIKLGGFALEAKNIVNALHDYLNTGMIEDICAIPKQLGSSNIDKIELISPAHIELQPSFEKPEDAQASLLNDQAGLTQENDLKPFDLRTPEQEE